MNIIKKAAITLSAIAVGAVGVVAGSSGVAEAKTYQPWTVMSNSAGSIPAWSGICGGNGITSGYPCGGVSVRSAGQTYPRTTDWDAVSFDSSRYCLRYTLNGSPIRTDCGSYKYSGKTAMKKFSTDQRVTIGLVRR